MLLNLELVDDIFEGDTGGNNPVPNNGNPAFLTVYEQELYFSANDGQEGVELFRYNPDDNTVTRVDNIFEGDDGGNPATPNSSNPSHLEVYEEELYFSADEGGVDGVELYKYNADDGVTQVANIFQGDNNDSNPTFLTVFLGDLYFSADDGEEGRELFKYNADDGVTRVDNIFEGDDGGNPATPNSSDPQHLAVYEGQLYFSADDGQEGRELFRYNPDDDTATRVDNIFEGNTGGNNPVPNSSNPAFLTVYNGELYFSADDGEEGGRELFKYNTDDGVARVTTNEINPQVGSNPQHLTVFRGELYFQANDGETGTEVHKYNSQTGETTLVANINRTGNSGASDLAVFLGELYLSANAGPDFENVGTELYKLTPGDFDGRFNSAQRASIGQDGDNFTPVNGGWTSQVQFPRTLADVNGDGLADIIGFGQTSVFVSLSEGDGSFGEANDVLNGFGPANGWTSQDQFPRTAGDINGDGRADLIGFGQTSVFVSLSQEDGTFGDVTNVLDGFSSSTGWTSQDQYPRMVGDFNGDGNDDLIGFGQTSVFVSLSDGDGTFGDVNDVLNDFTISNGGWSSQDQYPRMVGDFDGDGNDDIIGFGFNDVFVSFSNGDGTFDQARVAAIGGPDIGEEEGEEEGQQEGQQEVVSTSGFRNFTVNSGGWTSQNELPRTVADINGDGRDDIVGFGQDSIFYSLSEGDGSFTEAEVLSLDGANNFTVGSGGWTTQSLFPRFADDINGDEVADIVGFGSQSVFAALA